MQRLIDVRVEVCVSPIESSSHTIERWAVELGTEEVRVIQVGALESSALQVRILEMRSLQSRPMETRPLEMGAPEMPDRAVARLSERDRWLRLSHLS